MRPKQDIFKICINLLDSLNNLVEITTFVKCCETTRLENCGSVVRLAESVVMSYISTFLNIVINGQNGNVTIYFIS